MSWSDGVLTATRTDTNVVADIDVTATFATDTHQVSFNSNGGTAVGSQTIAFGSLVATPVPDPDENRHAFAGWFADAGLTVPWHFATDTVGATDLTLHAKWVANGYTVSFNSNGGTAVGSQTIAFGSLVATPVPDPVRTGHAFAGWYADAALTDPWTSRRYRWSRRSDASREVGRQRLPVSFNSNGGTAVGSQTIAFGSLVATPVPDPEDRPRLRRLVRGCRTHRSVGLRRYPRRGRSDASREVDDHLHDHRLCGCPREALGQREDRRAQGQ